MSTKYNRNFTNFQNLSVSGSGTGVDAKVGFIEMQQGATNAASTLSISMLSGSTGASINGSVEAPYFHISNAGLSLGTGYIRLTANGSSPYGTLSVASSFEEDGAWQLPGDNGIIPTMGTLSVGLESISANSTYSTNIVLGDEKPDASYIFGFSRLNGTATTRGFPIYIGNTPTANGVELFFINADGTATVAGTWQMNYVRVR